MIALNQHQAVMPQAMFDYSASQDGRFGWFLLTWHPEQDNVLEEIQTQIKLDIRNADIGNISRLEIESWLKSFFTEYHWKLHATFRKTNLKEKGISLLLAVLYDHELFVVEFGRMLCGLSDKDNLTPCGRQWQNFHVKNMDELNLLGKKEADISVKPFRIYIAEQTKFVALPSTYAIKLSALEADYVTLETVLPAVFGEDDPCFFVLEGKSKLILSRKPHLKRFQLTAIIILILTLLTVLYMRYGNRSIESSLRKIRLLLSSKTSLTVENIPAYLNIESETIKRQLRKIEIMANMPARSIGLNEIWQTNINYLITAPPAFDLSNIYLASEKTLMAFAKSDKKLVWKKGFDANIKDISVVRGNVVVFLDNGQMYCLKGGNRILWHKDYTDAFPVNQSLAPLEITEENDPRLNGSILLVPSEHGMYVYEVTTGSLITEITFPKRLQSLSSYDSYDNCFYAVVANGIHCIRLDILN